MTDSDREMWEVLRQLTNINIRLRTLDEFLRKHGLYTKGGKLELDLEMSRTTLIAWTSLFEAMTKDKEPPPSEHEKPLL